MKRLHIINQPTALTELNTLLADDDAYSDGWQLKMEKMNVKRLRDFRRQGSV